MALLNNQRVHIVYPKLNGHKLGHPTSALHQAPRHRDLPPRERALREIAHAAHAQKPGKRGFCVKLPGLTKNKWVKWIKNWIWTLCLPMVKTLKTLQFDHFRPYDPTCPPFACWRRQKNPPGPPYHRCPGPFGTSIGRRFPPDMAMGPWGQAHGHGCRFFFPATTWDFTNQNGKNDIILYYMIWNYIIFVLYCVYIYMWVCE